MKIVDIKVKVGDRVQEDDEIAILEAMKMEMPIVAPAAGVVKEEHSFQRWAEEPG